MIGPLAQHAQRARPIASPRGRRLPRPGAGARRAPRAARSGMADGARARQVRRRPRGRLLRGEHSPSTARCATASASANGTDALELILAGLGIGPGDEVIVPTNTFVATAEAVVAVGATPGSSTCSPTPCWSTPTRSAAADRPATAAVIAVHLFGQMADMTALSALAERHGLALIEDAAQAHGARFAGRRAGSWGVAGGVQLLPRQEPRAPSATVAPSCRTTAHWSTTSAGSPTTGGRVWTGTRTRSPAATAGSTRCRPPSSRSSSRDWTPPTGRGLRRSSATARSCRRGVSRWPCTRRPSRCTTSPSSRCPTAQPPRRRSTTPRWAGVCTTRALPPAAGVRRVRHRAVAGGRGRRRPHPVAPAPPRADRGTGG